MSRLEIAHAGAMAVAVPSVATRASRARKLLRLLGAAYVLLTGCAGGQLDPRAQRAVDTFECYVGVVAPYVGEAVDVVELVQDAIAGRANLQQALALLGATEEDLGAINAGLVMCRQPPPVAAPVNPRTLAFRDPPW